MIRTRGLAHLNLNVRDIERSKRFCRELFGLELLHDYQGPTGKHQGEDRSHSVHQVPLIFSRGARCPANRSARPDAITSGLRS